MELPISLREALEKEVQYVSAKELALSTAELSNRYRTGRSTAGESFFHSPSDFVAYAAFRMPATYGAVHAALGEVEGLMPDWQPHTLLDVGAGPGTASWAAAALWPGLTAITLLEREADMISLGKTLAVNSGSEALSRADWINADLLSRWNMAPRDLVTASYCLNEFSEANASELVKRLWGATAGVLVIVEPGTPEGYSRIRQYREIVLNEGGYVVAPCPHSSGCPVAGDYWCHFSARVSRSRLHRLVKEGELSYEDEKYSYIAVSRTRGSAVGGRVLRNPQVTKGYIRFSACTPHGLDEVTALRRDKDAYKTAKHLEWGSTVPGGLFDIS